AVPHAGELRLHLVVTGPGERLVDRKQIEDAGPAAGEIDRRVRIGGGAHDGFADLVGRIEQGDGVVRDGGGFAYLLLGVVESHDAGAHRRQARAGDDERVAVQAVEALRDIAGQFEVLRLVLA